VVQRLTIKDHPLYTVAFSPDGTRLVAGGWDGSLCVWETATGILLHPLEGHPGHVYSVAFDPAGDRLVSGDTAGAIRMWHVGGAGEAGGGPPGGAGAGGGGEPQCARSHLRLPPGAPALGRGGARAHRAPRGP